MIGYGKTHPRCGGHQTTKSMLVDDSLSSAHWIFTLVTELIYPTAATAHFFVNIRTSSFRLPSLTADQQLSRNILGFQCQTGSA